MFVHPSVPSFSVTLIRRTAFFLTLMWHAVHTRRDSLGAAHEVASIHFCLSVRRTVNWSYLFSFWNMSNWKSVFAFWYLIYLGPAKGTIADWQLELDFTGCMSFLSSSQWQQTAVDIKLASVTTRGQCNLTRGCVIPRRNHSIVCTKKHLNALPHRIFCVSLHHNAAAATQH